MRSLFALAALASLAIAQPQSDLYRRTHDALLASFLPVNEIKKDPQLKPLLQAADDGIWDIAGANPQFRQASPVALSRATFGSGEPKISTSLTAAFSPPLSALIQCKAFTPSRRFLQTGSPLKNEPHGKKV
jgi:hypothetical protein